MERDFTERSSDFPAMSLQAMLSLNLQDSLFPAMDYLCGSTSVAFPATNIPATVGFDQKLKSVVSTDPFGFTHYGPGSSFGQLPELQSLEHGRRRGGVDDFAGECSQKRAKTASFGSMIRKMELSAHFNVPEVRSPPPAPAPAPTQNTVGSQKRQKISDKTRCLQKLLPWDKKMDTSTMLEEAFKYIKFLQAQVSVLHSMPSVVSGNPNPNPNYGNGYGALGRLNRQQLLEVVVNSPPAQTLMYAKGWCVFSGEQLIALQQIADRNTLYQQILFGAST